MAKEELAEEFADRARIVDENTRAGDDCISLVQDYEGNVMDIHQRIKTAYLAGYNKANEWHYVKDGEYPEELETVVCFCKGYCGVSYGITAELVIGVDGVYRWWTIAGEGKSEQLIDVIAWKEIVLPELPKEN